MSTPPVESSGPRIARSAADIRAWIVSQVSRAMKIDPATVDPAAPLDSLGLDSLAAMGITGELAGWLGHDLPATLMWDYASIQAIAAGLADRDASIEPPTWPGVVTLQPNGDQCPIFFFPGQGGHPRTFTALASHLGPSQPCYGLTVPGLNGEEEPRNQLEQIATAMLQNIRRVQKNGPYQLVGYSFGGLLAYEAAQQLVAAGETVSLLAIFDAFTPEGRTVRPRWLRFALNAYRRKTWPARERHFLPRLKSRPTARKADGNEVESVPHGAHVALMANVTKVGSANAEAAARYEPSPYPGSVLVFRAMERALRNIFFKMDPSCGWGALALGGIRVIDLPGRHASLLDTESAAAAAEVLRVYLLRNREFEQVS